MNNVQCLDIDVVVRQYHELGSCTKVAELYGCSFETVRRFLKGNGVSLTGWRHPEKVKKHRFKATEELKKQAVELFNSTQDFKECCRELGCSNTTLYKILNEYGVHYANVNAWVNSSQADAVAEFYVQGHTVAETAQTFGVSKHQVNNLVKKRHITNGHAFHECGRFMPQNVRQAEAARKKLEERLRSLGFELIAYTNNNGTATVKCLACGSVFDRTAGFLRNGNVICRRCEHEKALQRQAKARRLARQQAEVRAIEQKWHQLTHPHKPKDYYEDLHNEFLNRSGVCEICGKPYTVREYVESCGLKQARNNGVCSEKCRRIKLNRQGRNSRKRRGVRDNHRHRAAKYGCAYDSSVTLMRLIERDGLQCKICGEMCDPNDHSWAKYSGPKYPSIDHIIPMSKGGGHVWSNVQVAHIICNSEKGDSLVE